MSRSKHAQPKKQHFTVTVVYPDGREKTVDVKASSREVAERRALKFHPNAVGVK
jgi:hypothetical protein